VAYFLLVYDRDAGRLIRMQRFDADAEALQARFDAEDEFRGRSEVEIVSLTAGSEQDLRRTHGRYFLDLAQLVDRMS
jgi:hypothetical protein